MYINSLSVAKKQSISGMNSTNCKLPSFNQSPNLSQIQINKDNKDKVDKQERIEKNDKNIQNIQNYLSSTISSHSKSPLKVTYKNNSIEKTGIGDHLLKKSKNKLEKNKSAGNLNSMMKNDRSLICLDNKSKISHYGNWRSTTKGLFSMNSFNGYNPFPKTLNGMNITHLEEDGDKDLSFRNYFLKFDKYKPPKISFKSSGVTTSYGANIHQGIFR